MTQCLCSGHCHSSPVLGHNACIRLTSPLTQAFTTPQQHRKEGGHSSQVFTGDIITSPVLQCIVIVVLLCYCCSSLTGPNLEIKLDRRNAWIGGHISVWALWFHALLGRIPQG